MKKWIAIVIAICITTFCFAPAQAGGANEQVNLWAGISVPQSVMPSPLPKTFMVQFNVVNDGTKTVNPKIESSHLLINGKEPKDWNFIINNGLRGLYFYALPPGKTLVFGMGLKRYFEKPGIYKVRWEGENFKSSEITFRVVPKDSFH
jgi:hypothetical protein